MAFHQMSTRPRNILAFTPAPRPPLHYRFRCPPPLRASPTGSRSPGRIGTNNEGTRRRKSVHGKNIRCFPYYYPAIPCFLCTFFTTHCSIEVPLGTPLFRAAFQRRGIRHLTGNNLPTLLCLLFSFCVAMTVT